MEKHHTMIYAALISFALAAVLGATIFLKWMNNSTASRGVIYGHGIFAAAALVMLIAFTFQDGSSLYIGTSVAFTIVALVGFYLFSRDMKGQRPIGVAWLHALVAVATFAVLLIATVG